MTKEWQSLADAPRDGTEVLLLATHPNRLGPRMYVAHWMPGGHCIEDHPPIVAGWYFDTGRCFDKAYKPLAWLPLPEIPEEFRQ